MKLTNDTYKITECGGDYLNSNYFSAIARNYKLDAKDRYENLGFRFIVKI